MNKKRVATQAERFRIAKLLEEYLSQKDADGCVNYFHDMTDTKIAAIIGPHLSPSTVTNMRQQIFGHLRKPKVDTLEERVTALENRLDHLCIELGVGGNPHEQL